MLSGEQLSGQPPLETFVENIKKRVLPIDERDARLFGEFILRHGPPQGFLERLLAAFQYVDKKQFDKDFQVYSDMVKTQVANKPYVCALFDPDGSNLWIYKKLLESGLHSADKVFAYGLDDNLNNHLMTDLRKMAQLVPTGSTILVPDDLTITGAQLSDPLSQISKNHESIVAVLYTTAAAKNRIENNGQKYFLSVKELIPANQWLTQTDMDFLQDLTYKVSGDEMAVDLTDSTKALFWTWYKVPDNMFPIITADLEGVIRTSNPPLIRPERFKQPYRKS